MFQNQMVPEGSYMIDVFCTNCRRANNVIIKLGLVASYEIEKMECTNCGCTTLIQKLE